MAAVSLHYTNAEILAAINNISAQLAAQFTAMNYQMA